MATVAFGAVELLVGDLLASAAAARPSGIAATLGATSTTYRDADRDANRIAHHLRGLGVEPGRTVVWWSGPCLASIAGFAGVARTGAVFASLSPALGRREAAESLEYLHPRLVVAAADVLDAAKELTIGSGADVCSLDGLGAGASDDLFAPKRPVHDDEPHVIYMTSGTTGRPKGVVVSHRASWLRSFPGGSTFAAGLRGDGGILPSFPLFHYGGWHYVLEAWHHRCAFHMASAFDGPGLLVEAQRWRPSAMYCIPAVWNRVLAAPASGGELDAVMHADTGTSAAPPELLEDLRRRMPQATTSVLYGSSEGGHHTTLHDREVARKPGSVGRAAPPGSIRVSEEGEILYRSPTLMDGYFERRDETESAIRDGWYHTGDLGSTDDEGFLYITGRKREVIRTGGESVAPPEVEAVVAAMAGVADVAVIGLADDQWGEIVCAVVVAEPGVAAPTVAQVRAHIGERLAPFKHPRLVIEADAIPRTPATGQVQRTLLREAVGAQRARSGGGWDS
jgi:fatty-acyl-CoA synthase